MNDDDLVKLSAGRLELLLSPTAGGSILRFDWIGGDERTQILRGCNNVSKNMLDMANFPLVPFVNRIRGGRFRFRGQEVSLRPNLDGDPSPLHGQGWLNSWKLVSQGETEAELAFVHEPGEWPWRYGARQRLRLDRDGLSLHLSCRNLSEKPMPCGLGQHPYFPCTPETVIDTRVSHVWTIDEHVLPVEKVPAEGRFGLANRRVCGQDLDHGFAGWGGSAHISTPEMPFELLLSSADAGFFQVYSPATGGLFVAEPVTHANAALNAPEEEWAELGMQVLEPGEEMILDMRLDVKAVA